MSGKLTTTDYRYAATVLAKWLREAPWDTAPIQESLDDLAGGTRTMSLDVVISLVRPEGQ